MTLPRPWLITGGAGYIGSHVVRSMLDAGMQVVVADDFSTGLPERLPHTVPCYEIDCRKSALVRNVILRHDVVGVVHLAASKQARESVREPMRYWDNNVGSMLGVLDSLDGTAVRKFILSSSCSVYGGAGLIGPTTPIRPMSPYARTKHACEMMLQDVAPSLGIASVTLRYFNVVGNDDFRMAHDTSTECLLPAAYRKFVAGDAVRILGARHATPDGTALRDYVDVRDLADAHTKAALHLQRVEGSPQLILDVGVGRPSSVREVLQALESVVDEPLRVEVHEANEVDPPAVWADASKIREVLNWEPKHDLSSSVEAHVRSASQVLE